MSTAIAKKSVTPRQYQVLKLIKHDRLSTPEIADEMRISFDSARGLVRRLRDRGMVRTFAGRGKRPEVTVDLRTVRPKSD